MTKKADPDANRSSGTSARAVCHASSTSTSAPRATRPSPPVTAFLAFTVGPRSHTIDGAGSCTAAGTDDGRPREHARRRDVQLSGSSFNCTAIKLRRRQRQHAAERPDRVSVARREGPVAEPAILGSERERSALTGSSGNGGSVRTRPLDRANRGAGMARRMPMPRACVTSTGMKTRKTRSREEPPACARSHCDDARSAALPAI